MMVTANGKAEALANKPKPKHRPGKATRCRQSPLRLARYISVNQTIQAEIAMSVVARDA